MTRADIQLFTPPANQPGRSQSNFVVKTAAGVLYHFLVDTTSDLFWIKSTDGGLTWTVPVLLYTGSVHLVSCWYDRWTPGNSGNLIHMVYTEGDASDVHYNSINTSDDSLGTETTVFAGASAVSGSSQALSITRAIGGNLYVLGDIDGGAETFFARSTDVGATWGSRTDANEGPGTDYYHLAPGFAADTQDIICIYWDRSADEISRKLYDDSANSWAETSITEGTNVVLNSVDDQQCSSIALDLTTNAIWVWYGGKSDGSETAGTSIGIYYKTSVDGGTTWSAEQQWSVLNANYHGIYSSLTFTGTPAVMLWADEAIDFLRFCVDISREARSGVGRLRF